MHSTCLNLCMYVLKVSLYIEHIVYFILIKKLTLISRVIKKEIYRPSYQSETVLIKKQCHFIYNVIVGDKYFMKCVKHILLWLKTKKKLKMFCDTTIILLL